MKGKVELDFVFIGSKNYIVNYIEREVVLVTNILSRFPLIIRPSKFGKNGSKKSDGDDRMYVHIPPAVSRSVGVCDHDPSIPV